MNTDSKAISMGNYILRKKLYKVIVRWATFFSLSISTIRRKQKIAGTNSSAIPCDEYKFRSYIHEKLYTKLKSRNLIQEKN